MKGCEAWNALCAAGTKVDQCLKNPPAVGVPTTYNTKADIDVSREGAVTAALCCVPLLCGGPCTCF